ASRTSIPSVLERQRQLGAIALDLAVLELHVERGDFRHAEVAQGLGGPLDRCRRRFLPRLGARSDQLDDLIDAVRHVQVSGVRGPAYFLVTVFSRSTFLENQNTSRATIRKSTVAPSTGPARIRLLPTWPT